MIVALWILLGRLRAWMLGRRYGDYIWTASCGKFWPLDPRADEVRSGDIARGLANRCRYNGQTGLTSRCLRYYSVAEHSVLVSREVERVARLRGWDCGDAREAALAALLHDGSEAYISDVARPLKYSLEMRGYRRIEARVQRSVYEAFGVVPGRQVEELIKVADNRILVDEIRAVMDTNRGLGELVTRWGEPLGCVIQGLDSAAAENLWRERFVELR